MKQDVERGHRRSRSPSRRVAGGRRSPRRSSAAQPSRAYSPIVIAGCVRFLDLSIVLFSGAFVRWFYLDAGDRPLARIRGRHGPRGLRERRHVPGDRHQSARRIPSTCQTGLSTDLRPGARVSRRACSGVLFSSSKASIRASGSPPGSASQPLCLMVERALVSGVVRRLAHMGQLDRRTVIVGGGPAAAELLGALQHEDTDLRIYGFFDDRTDDSLARRRGRLSQARQCRRSRRIRPPCAYRPCHFHACRSRRSSAC